MKYLQLEAAIASKATSSVGDHCANLSAHNSSKGCFSGAINSSWIDLHKDLKSFSLAQKKHWNKTLFFYFIKIYLIFHKLFNCLDNCLVPEQ